MIPALVIAFAACAALVYVVAPLLRPERVTVLEPVPHELLARKRTALTALIELEEERDAGKLGSEDFELLRRQYEAEAVVALRELDLVTLPRPVDQALEEEIAAARALLRCPACGERRSGEGRCPQCGH